MSVTRRQVIARSGAVGAGIVFSGALCELFVGTATAQGLGHFGYGPLIPDPDGLLDLPKGFRYKVLSREGDPLHRSDEGRVPSNHDGMAAFGGSHGRVHLVRNHENRHNGRIAVPTVKGLTYDPMGKGGCTALTLDGLDNVLSERVAIAGTAVNCAGGRTPWGTWLTCEETEDKAGTNGYTKDHGFIFEVDPADPHRTGAVPLTAMGRFPHEAIAVDPRRGVVYETEDAFEKPFGLFYRFLPDKPEGGRGSLRAGGRLQALRVPGVPDLSSIQQTGATFDGITWVDVPDPLAAQTPIRLQDFGPKGITRAQKLEGCYWGGRSVYFVSSYARSAEGSAADHYGQVWRYDPERRRLTLVIVFGPGTDVQLPGESPDNICLAPSGGLMVCEDGNGAQHIFGVTRHGEVYALARNAQALTSASPTPPTPGFSPKLSASPPSSQLLPQALGFSPKLSASLEQGGPPRTGGTPTNRGNPHEQGGPPRSGGTPLSAGGTEEKPKRGEFAGVTFSPDGETMYVNCYTPGTTFAVTGPWRRT